MSSSLIVVILTSSVVSGLVTFGLNTYKEERTLKRQKLETLYINVSEWIKLLGLYGLDYGYAMQGKITLDQVYDMLNKKSDPKNSFENMLMLVGVYFPRLRGVLTELLSCRESLTSLVARFERGYKNGEIDGARFLPEFNKVVDHLGGIEKKFKDEIVREADFINRPWMRLWPYLRDNKGKRVLL